MVVIQGLACRTLDINFVFYIMPSTLSVTLRWVFGRAEETIKYIWSRFCKLSGERED